MTKENLLELGDLGLAEVERVSQNGDRELWNVENVGKFVVLEDGLVITEEEDSIGEPSFPATAI